VLNDDSVGLNFSCALAVLFFLSFQGTTLVGSNDISFLVKSLMHHKRYCLFLHISPYNVVYLPVICRLHALCLNGLTDLDVIWQVYLWGSVTR